MKNELNKGMNESMQDYNGGYRPMTSQGGKGYLSSRDLPATDPSVSNEKGHTTEEALDKVNDLVDGSRRPYSALDFPNT